MAITASRTTLGMDREVNSEAASQRARRSLLNKGYRQARKEKDYGKALAFSDKMDEQGMPRGTTGSAENVGSLAMGRVASRESLATQMRGQLPALAGQTREGNIAAAKRSGTFDATRSAYNEKAGAFGKQMDEQGNIAATPPVAGAKPVAGAGAGAGAGATPRQALLNSPAMPPSKVSAPGGLMTPPSAAQLNAANPQTPLPAMTPQTADQIKAGQTPTPTIGGTGLPELPKGVNPQLPLPPPTAVTPSTPEASATPADPELAATLKQASALAGAFKSGDEITRLTNLTREQRDNETMRSAASSQDIKQAARDSASARLKTQASEADYTKLRGKQSAEAAALAQAQDEADTARQAERDRLARRPGLEKAGEALARTTQGMVTAGNEAVEGGVKFAANVDQALEPLAEWAKGSSQKSPAELKDERLKARLSLRDTENKLPKVSSTAGEKDKERIRLARRAAINVITPPKFKPTS